MGTLDAYGFPEFADDDSIIKAFLENVEGGLSLGSIPLIPGTDAVIPLPFPDAPLTPGFWNSDDTVSSHSEKYPKYHDIIFPMMGQIASALNLPTVFSSPALN